MIKSVKTNSNRFNEMSSYSQSIASAKCIQEKSEGPEHMLSKTSIEVNLGSWD